MNECPYGWPECAYCLTYGDYKGPDDVVKTLFYECTAPECENPDYCPCYDVTLGSQSSAR